VLDAEPHTRLDDHQQDTGHATHFAPTPSGCRHTWHVVASYPKAERRAHAALHLKGYEPYLPLLTTRRPDRSWHTAALFPGYLFIRLDLQRPWYPIRYAPGVYSLILTEGVPSICPDAVISVLQAGDALRATPIPESRYWAPGAAVAVSRGAFAQHQGVLLEVAKDRASVLLMVFGQLRSVSVDLDCLENPAG
jgi:transcription antitermination factor NusG